MIACVGSEIASGRSGKQLRKGLKRLPAENIGIVAYG